MSTTSNTLMGLPSGIISAAYWSVTGQQANASKSQMVAALARAIDAGTITLADVRRLGQSPAPVAVAAPVAPTAAPAALVQRVDSMSITVSDQAAVVGSLMRSMSGMDDRIANVGQQSAALYARFGSLETDIAGLHGRVDVAAQASHDESKSLRAQVQALADSVGQITVSPTEVAAAMRVAVEAAFAPIAAAAAANGTEADVLETVQAGPVGRQSAIDLFGIDVRDVNGAPLEFDCYGHPEAPPVDPCFIWTPGIVQALYIGSENGRNLWLGGPAGTGKTQTAQQFAARTGRMFRRFVFDRFATRDDYLGAVGLEGGDTAFQLGPVLEVYTTPGAVCLLDEVGMGQSGALSALNAFLERGARVAYAGKVWHRAPGTMFLAADNSLGQGDASGRFAGVQAMNTAFLERFSLVVPFTYLDPALEAEALVRHTGCTLPLANHLVEALGTVRAKVSSGDIIDAPSIRQMVAFVEACRVMSPHAAWLSTIAARQPVESEAGLAAVFAASINPGFVLAQSQIFKG